VTVRHDSTERKRIFTQYFKRRENNGLKRKIKTVEVEAATVFWHGNLYLCSAAGGLRFLHVRYRKDEHDDC
jgi:hypothetical protein